MIEIEQRDQNIDVEKCPPQSSSASRSRSIISFVTIAPRRAKIPPTPISKLRRKKWLEHLLANIVRPNSEPQTPNPKRRTP
jgi:hypothetical protein